MSDLTKKRVITVAVTGSWPTKEDNPNVPIHPEEIAQSVFECWKAGAAVAHILCGMTRGSPAWTLKSIGRWWS